MSRSRQTALRPLTGPVRRTFFPGHEDSIKLPSLKQRLVPWIFDNGQSDALDTLCLVEFCDATENASCSRSLELRKSSIEGKTTFGRAKVPLCADEARLLAKSSDTTRPLVHCFRVGEGESFAMNGSEEWGLVASVVMRVSMAAWRASIMDCGGWFRNAGGGGRGGG